MRGDVAGLDLSELKRHKQRQGQKGSPAERQKGKAPFPPLSLSPLRGFNSVHVHFTVSASINTSPAVREKLQLGRVELLGRLADFRLDAFRKLLRPRRLEQENQQRVAVFVFAIGLTRLRVDDRLALVKLHFPHALHGAAAGLFFQPISRLALGVREGLGILRIQERLVVAGTGRAGRLGGAANAADLAESG